jgi:hypothetical protein
MIDYLLILDQIGDRQHNTICVIIVCEKVAPDINRN